MVLEAAHFAASRHATQRRKGGRAGPYINHPIEVAMLLATVGGMEDPEVLAAALLHDTVEDTGTTPEEVEERFGNRVRDLVMQMTDDKSLPKEERKERQVTDAPHKSREARCIKLGDKITNVRDIAMDPPADWPLERRERFLDWAERVVSACGPTNAALEARFAETLALGRQRLGTERQRNG